MPKIGKGVELRLTTAALWLAIGWASAGIAQFEQTGTTAEARRAPAVVSLPAPSSKAWRTVTLRGVENETRYTPLETGSSIPAGAVHAESECSASLLVLSLDDIDLMATPRLRWRWRVDRALDVEGEQGKMGDDFAARVHVAFALDPERTRASKRVKSALAAIFYGRALPGSALNYVWTSHLSPGTRWANPHAATSHMIALARGALGTWREEEVDVLADYRAAFGREPTRLTGIGVMSDSDNSCQHGAASFAGFEFAAWAQDRATIDLTKPDVGRSRNLSPKRASNR